jgi:hypothetical protein
MEKCENEMKKILSNFDEQLEQLAEIDGYNASKINKLILSHNPANGSDMTTFINS